MSQRPSYEDLEKRIRQLEKEAIDCKQIESELKASEQRFKDIADNALEWIWEIDSEGRYVYSSPIVKQILGYEAKDILGKYFYDFFHPEDRDELKTLAFRTFKDHIAFRQFINRNIDKDGKTVILSTSGVPLLNMKGELIGYRGADTDITLQYEALKKLQEREENLSIREKELEIKTRELEQMNSALNILLKKRDQDKFDTEESISANVKQLIIPYLSKIGQRNLNHEQQTLLSIINSNLNEITAAFTHRLTSKFIGLSPTEIRVADLVRQGQKTKQIAKILCLSQKTIESHRENIRKKLGIKNRKINLRSYLMSIQ